MAANKIQVGYIEPQDGVQFKVDEGTAAAPGVCFVDSTATGLYSPGTGQIAWSTSGKQTALRILADGKVGIDCSPTVALEVNGTIKASAIDAPIEGTLDDWIVHAGDTNTKLGFPAADEFEIHTGGGPRLRIDSSGRVLLGVTDTTNAHGSFDDLIVKASNGANAGITIVTGTSNQATIAFSDGTSGTAQYNGYIQYSNNGDKLALGAGGDDRLTITSTGAVSIGAGNSPVGKLEIMGTGSGSGYHQLTLSSNKTANTNKLAGLSVLDYVGTGNKVSVFQTYCGNGANTIYWGSADSSARGFQNHMFYVNASSTATTNHQEALRIDSNGNIGVNCDSPTNLSNNRGITIKGAGGNPAGFINFMDSANNSDGRILADAGQLIFTADPSDNTANSAISFNVDGTSEKLRITATGKVNIGGNLAQTNAPLCVTTSANDYGIRLMTGSNVVTEILNNDSAGNCEIRGYYNNNSGTRGEGFRFESSGDSFFTGGRLLVGTTAHSISSSEVFEVKSTGSGFSHFRNNHSGYATIYIDNEYSDTGYAPLITFTDGGGNRGGIGQDQNDLLRIHGQGGVEFVTNSTHGGGTQTAKFSSSSGESYLTIVGDKAPAGTGGNLILQNLNTTGQAASTVQFADHGGQTISAINGVCVDHGTNEGYLTFHTRTANAAPVERLRLSASNHIHMFNPAANGADKLNILGGGDGISIARGTGNASDGNILGNLSFHTYTSGSYHANAEAKIEAVAATIKNQTNSGSNAPTDLLFYTKSTGYGPGSAPQESMRIHAQGVVKTKYGTDEQNNGGDGIYTANVGYIGSQFTTWGPLFPFFYLGETSSGSGSTSFHALDSYASHHWGGFPRMMIFGHYRYYGAGFSAWTYGNYGGSSYSGELYLVTGWGGYGAGHVGSLPSSQTGSGVNCSVTQTRTNNVAVHSGVNVHRWKLDFNTSGAHVYIRWYVGFMGTARGLYTSEKSQADVTSSCSAGGCVHLRTMNRNHFRNCSYLD